jgi:hypothetical protein
MTTTQRITFIGVYGKPAGKLAANTQQTGGKSVIADAANKKRPPAGSRLNEAS